MTTLTEVVAAVVMHSSAVAFSHFGVHLAPTQLEKPTPAAERVIARTPRRAEKMSEKLSDCPDQQRAAPQALKA
jgi:hypothetical protein